MRSRPLTMRSSFYDTDIVDFLEKEWRVPGSTAAAWIREAQDEGECTKRSGGHEFKLTYRRLSGLTDVKVT